MQTTISVFTLLPLLNLVVIPVAAWVIKYLLRIERRLMKVEVHLGIADD